VREQFEGNYSIIEAQNGEEGIEKAIHHLPHLIISDVMMPKKMDLKYAVPSKRM
jgi:YesN/AraC family two-component response regulator